MSEKTPFIVLTVVFVVGIVGFAMMMTDANTGAYISGEGSSIYAKTRIAAETPGGDPSQTNRQALGNRALFGSTVQYGRNIEDTEAETGIYTGKAYTSSGQAIGNLAISGTVQKEDSSSIPYKRVIENERGCKVYNVKRRIGQTGLQYPAGTPALRESIRMLECYLPGEETVEGEIPMIRSVIQNRPLIWDKVNANGEYERNTACCFSSGLKPTY